MRYSGARTYTVPAGAAIVRIANSRDLGYYLRERRNGLGLTQAQLATKAKVSRRWLASLEAGKETAEFGLVLRTLHALGVILDLQPHEKVSTLDLDAVLDRYRSRPTGQPTGIGNRLGLPPLAVDDAVGQETANVGLADADPAISDDRRPERG
jgi:y4mF family transcriptional regulator